MQIIIAMWPSEVFQKESKYPLRIKYQVLNISDNWSVNKVTLHGTGIDYYRGINHIALNMRAVAQSIMNRLAAKSSKATKNLSNN